MSYKKTNADRSRVQNQAWIDARNFFKGATNLAEAVNKKLKPWEKHLNAVTINAWISQNRSPPHQYCVIVALLTGISLERLSPFTTSANGENFPQKNNKKTLMQCQTQKILVPSDFYDPITTVGLWIIVDSEGVLISGVATLQWYRDQGKAQIPAIVVDFAEIKPGYSFLEAYDFRFSISQKSAIIAVLKKTANRQGFRSDLCATTVAPKKVKKAPPLRSLGYEVGERTHDWMTKTFGFTSKDLLVRAQKIYQKAPECLIQAVNVGEIEITKAQRMLKKPDEIEAFKKQASEKALKILKMSEKKECHDEAIS